MADRPDLSEVRSPAVRRTRRTTRHHRATGGYSLIEVIVMSAVIAVLALLGTYGYQALTEGAASSTAATTLQGAQLAETLYHQSRGTWAVDETDLAGLSDGTTTLTSGPSTGTDVVSVAADGTELVLAVADSAGQCVYLRVAPPGDTTTYTVQTVDLADGAACDAETVDA